MATVYRGVIKSGEMGVRMLVGQPEVPAYDE
jgi:hypothetical protein